MPATTISHNTPTPGSIAWTAFNISYGGVGYPVAAGNSAAKFVWWEYRNGTPAVVSGDTLPSLTADDTILFLNKGGIGALQPETTVVDGSLIVSQSILTDAIGANQINAGHIISDAVQARHILAGTITTDKLNVGSVGDSLVTNGSFEEIVGGMPTGWTASVSGTGSVDIVTGVASSGTNAARLVLGSTTTTSTLFQTPDRYIPVTSGAGRKWYIAAMVGAGTATTRGLFVRATWFDANKVQTTYQDAVANVAVGTTFALYEGQVTPPATARYMRIDVIGYQPNVISNFYVDEVVAREVVITAQMADGAVTAAKILAGTITADRIAGGTITADKLLVTDRTNLWENPDFEGDAVGGIPRGTTLANTTLSRIISGGAQSSARAMELDARNGANNDVYGSAVFPVEPGDQYYVRMDYKFLNALGASSAGVGFRTYGPTKAAIAWSGVATTTARPTAWTTHPGGIYTVPAGVYFLQPWVTFGNNGETTNRFHVDDIVIRRMNGGELIVDGAVVAAKIATDAVEAGKIKAGAVTASKLESELVLASKIIAGSPTGTRAEMAPDGFRVYANGSEVVRMGVAASDDYFAVTKADGSLAATISQDGKLSGSQVVANDYLYYKGFELSALLDDRPRGHVVSALRTTSGGVNAAGTTEQPYLRLEAPLKAGRLYKVWTSNIRMDLDSGTTGYTLLRQNSSGIATLTSPAMAQSRYSDNATSHPMTELYALPGTTDATVSFLISYGVATGSGQAGIRASTTETVRLTVEDIGPLRSTGNGVWIDGTTPPPAPVNTYTKQYGYTASMNYLGNNNQYNYDLGHVYQGLQPGTSNGNLKSITTFGDMTADLSGATINYVRVYLNFEFWYYNSGGTARIGVHGHTAIPATYSGVTLAETVPGWPKPGALWINLSPALFNGFKTGAYRGIALEGDGTLTTYGYAQRPIVEINYTK